MLSQSFRCERAKNSGFSRFHLILCGVLGEHILRNELFAKRFTKMTPAPPVELFMELKSKKIASLMKWSRAKRSLNIIILLCCGIWSIHLQWRSNI